jgi:hypothetical protein
MSRSIESVKPVQGGTYIDGADREGYVDRPMRLLGVQHEAQARFGPRWVVEAAMLDSGEKVLIALAGNQTRDTMFGQVREALDADGADAFEPMCLYLQDRPGGNSFWSLRSATDAEVEAAALADLTDPADEGDEPDEPTGSDDPGENDEAATEAVKGKRGK